MSLIALYYVCSVGIYYNMDCFKKHGTTHDNKNKLKCLPWNIILVKFDQNWSVHEAKYCLIFTFQIWRRQWNGTKYSESEIKNDNFTVKLSFLFNSKNSVIHSYLYDN